MTIPVTKTHLAKIMDRVAKMLAKAESVQETFPAEAAAFRAKAEQFMREYRIAEEDLIATDQTSIVPEWSKIEFGTPNNNFRQAYVNLAYYVATHAGVRIYPVSKWDPDKGHRVVYVDVCGYSGDLRAFEWIFNSARLAFQEALEPTLNPDLSDQVNVYRLRSAGIERNRIAQLLWGSAMDDGAAHGKVAKLYKAECAARGESPKVVGRTVNAQTYREAYSEGFQAQFYRRLREARDAADSTGGALVLHGRKARVDEEFYTRFPHTRPSTEVATVAPECSKCKKAKSGKCRDHTYRYTKADQAKYDRLYSSDAGMAGMASGKTAANSVELGRPERANRLREGTTTRGESIAREILG